MLSLGTIAAKIFGTSNDRKVKPLRVPVQRIAALEDELKALSDTELRARTQMFRDQLREGADLATLLEPAFATVREAARRTLGQRHFDVQMMGGMVLHDGNIAEMKTGEGKTLVATLPVYLNALSGRGVHVVTVNDYLAKRDSEWMGQVYRFLGLTVGVIVHELDDEQRREAYACDVTYGTNNEFGFDYLRDNMKMNAADMVQFGYRPAIRIVKLGLERLAAAQGNGHDVNGTGHADGEEPITPDLGALHATRQEVIGTCNRLLGELDRVHTRPGSSQDAGWPLRRQRLASIVDAAQAASGIGLEPITVLADAVLAEVEKLGAAPVQDPTGDVRHYFAIVDEVDSILIDEARTPLIISGPVEDRSELYTTVDTVIPRLVAEDFELDEKQRQVALTEAGNERIEGLLVDSGILKYDPDRLGKDDNYHPLYDIENVSIVHHVNQALKAHKLFQKDRDYIVKSGQVVIIDEFTGRMMQGRRYSEGLHQALEAKEKVEIQPENVTLASITFQNFFRLYEKLAGMTGTAATEASEFLDIYGLDVIEIPTNVPVARRDLDDEVYRTAREKWDAIIREIRAAQERGQPVLVGTVSIEKSEVLSELLKKHDIKHQVLNARYHEQEAFIIAQAGGPGAVTIATNMAGRGTDIQLGGNVQMRILQECAGMPDGPEKDKKVAAIKAEVEKFKQIVLNASDTFEIAPAKGNRAARTDTLPGGLFVIGTERHESRRIDNQLRGRSGRQGDPGRTKFYLSLEDDLMRIFAADRIDGMLQKLGLEEGEAITHSWINKALENAQRKVEARNFDSRKYVLKYDDVMNDQRKVIFDQRIDIMATEDVNETVKGMRQQVLAELVAKHIPENAYAEQWDAAGLQERVEHIFGLELPIADWAAEEGIADQEISERLKAAVDEKSDAITSEIGDEVLKVYEGAKGLVTFAETDPALKDLVTKDPTQNLTAIGRTLVSSNRGEIRITGGSADDALAQADRIGYDFLQQYMQAKGLVQGIDATGDKSPLAIGAVRIRDIEKSVLLQTLDRLWREHLVTLEHLRQVIGFRSYGQRDPLNEYKSESFQLFESMLARLREDVTGELMHIKIGGDEGMAMSPPEPAPLPPMTPHHVNPTTGEDEFDMAEAVLAAERSPPKPVAAKPEPVKVRKADGGVDPKDPTTWGKVSRNDKCPCGSGKKYKHCHGRH